MFPSCACGKKEVIFIKRVRTAWGVVHLIKCIYCGLIRRTGRLQELDDSYSDRAGIYYPPGSEEEFVEARWGQRRLVKRIMRMIGQQKRRVLDVGCHTGALLAEFAACGWVGHGIEYTKAAVEYARSKGLDVWQGDVMNYPFQSASFDLIILSHVLEHLADPRVLLHKLQGALDASGHLYIAVPNYAMALSYFPGYKRVDIIPNQHLWYFTPFTLPRLVRDSGYCIESVATHTVDRGGVNLLKWGAGRLLDALHIGENIELFAYPNMG